MCVCVQNPPKVKAPINGGVSRSVRFYEAVSGAVPFLLLISNRVSIDPEHLRCLSGYQLMKTRMKYSCPIKSFLLKLSFSSLPGGKRKSIPPPPKQKKDVGEVQPALMIPNV